MAFTNKLITLTGAASGIGRSTARLLAQRGALLSLADYNKAKLSEAHEELASLSSSKQIFSTPLDIRSTDSVNSWISKSTYHFDRKLDGCANIAGYHPLHPKNIEETPDEEFEQVMSINTTGLFRCLRAQLSPGAFSSQGGSIVNVGSVSGLVGFAGDSPYVASKHAVHGITKSVSKEAGARGIRVNAVAPGQTNTPMVQAIVDAKSERSLAVPPVSLERTAQPDEIARVIVWLLSEESSYVTGSVYRVDGGMLE